MLKDYLMEQGLDICVVSETWLTDTDEDKAWLSSQNLADLRIKMYLNNRKDRKGGGIALLLKDNLTIEGETNLNQKTFQATKWNIKSANTDLTVIGVYHPPFGSTVDNTPSAFLDEFTNPLAEVEPVDPNIILLGDFNIHVNKYHEDNNVQIFVDTLEAMGLTIKNDKATHEENNILDLIITELVNKIYVWDIQNGPYLSDHCVVHCKINISKPDLT